MELRKNGCLNILRITEKEREVLRDFSSALDSHYVMNTNGLLETIYSKTCFFTDKRAGFGIQYIGDVQPKSSDGYPDVMYITDFERKVLNDFWELCPILNIKDSYSAISALALKKPFYSEHACDFNIEIVDVITTRFVENGRDISNLMMDFLAYYKITKKVNKDGKMPSKKKIKEIKESVRSVFNEYCETENIKCFRIKRVDK